MDFQLPILYGNLLESDEKVIAHGCNCLGIMGAGVAAQIAKKHPLVWHANERDVKAHLFPPGAAQLVIVNPSLSVFNLATQETPGPCAKLEYVYLAFRNMAEKCAQQGIDRVAIPEIGCGLGGLYWDQVETMIQKAIFWIEARGHQLEIVRYVFKP
jgi:O-acetyl-ADP-ribose deacetylase (regulator of RNase III)